MRTITRFIDEGRPGPTLAPGRINAARPEELREHLLALQADATGQFVVVQERLDVAALAWFMVPPGEASEESPELAALLEAEAELEAVRRGQARVAGAARAFARRATITAVTDRAAALAALEPLLLDQERTAAAMRAAVYEQGMRAPMAEVERAVAEDRLALHMAHDLLEHTGDPRFTRRLDLHELYRPCGGDRAPSLQRHVARAPIIPPAEWQALLAALQAGPEKEPR